MVAAMLVMIIVLQRPCSEAVGRFVASFDPPDAAVPIDAATDGEELPSGYVKLDPEMTEEALRKAMSKARAEQAALDAGVDARP